MVCHSYEIGLDFKSRHNLKYRFVCNILILMQSYYWIDWTIFCILDSLSFGSAKIKQRELIGIVVALFSILLSI